MNITYGVTFQQYMQTSSVKTLLKLGIIGIAGATGVPLVPAHALTQNDLVSGGSVWLETTIAIAMVFVTTMAFSLQIARGYFIRVLNKFTLRLGADIWWLTYVLIRDGLLFMSFVMGLMVFFPGTFLDYDMAVPFMPLAVVLFGAALIIKLYFDADDNRNAFRLVTLFTFLGTMLWITGTIFVTETPLALSTLPSGALPPGISADSGFWFFVYSTFSSKQNLTLAMISFQMCFAALGLLAILGFSHPILHSRLPGLRKQVPTSMPRSSPTSAPISRATDSQNTSNSSLEKI